MVKERGREGAVETAGALLTVLVTRQFMHCVALLALFSVCACVL